MGRPITSAKTGPLSDPGLQIEVGVGDAATTYIILQKGTGKYLVANDGSGSEGIITLVAKDPSAIELPTGEGSIIIRLGSEIETAGGFARMKLKSVVLANAGSGYFIGDQVFFSGGTAEEGVVITVTSRQESGNITGFQLNAPGIYTATPPEDEGEVSTTTDGSGEAARFTPNWRVKDVIVTSGGGGYDNASPPVVTFTGGGAAPVAAGTSAMDSDIVDAVVLTTGGDGYESAPTVTFAGPGTGFIIGVKEAVSKLYNNTVSTFEGNKYPYDLVSGSEPSGSTTRGNIKGS